MTDKIKTLVPTEGRTVPQEDGSAWPTDNKGRPCPHDVPLTRYIRRRLADGDLIESGSTPAPVAAPVSAPAEPESTEITTRRRK